MTKRDLVLELVRRNGPIIPSDITAEVKEDTFLIGAFLSELVKGKLIYVTHAKIGGSPMYFVPNQRDKLFRLRAFLNEKDQEFYDVLSKHGVLRDSSLTPLEKASARKLKDFSIMLTVTISGKQEIFWKWHLLNHADATTAIKKIVGIQNPTPQAVPAPKIETQPEPQVEPQPKVETKIAEIPEEKQTQLAPANNISDKLFNKVKLYLDKEKIVVKGVEIIRSGKELEMIISIPSGIGKLNYYARIKDKKKCNDADLSVAFVQGQLKHLPVVFMTTGEITKKARDLLDSDFKSMAVVEKV
jgi:hypothetical protein